MKLFVFAAAMAAAGMVPSAYGAMQDDDEAEKIEQYSAHCEANLGTQVDCPCIVSQLEDQDGLVDDVALITDEASFGEAPEDAQVAIFSCIR